MRDEGGTTSTARDSTSRPPGRSRFLPPAVRSPRLLGLRAGRVQLRRECGDVRLIIRRSAAHVDADDAVRDEGVESLRALIRPGVALLRHPGALVDQDLLAGQLVQETIGRRRSVVTLR